jgi:hypothetical protein
MGQDLLAAFRKTYNAAQNQTGNISLANLRKVVAEEVKAAVTGAGAQDKRSWAAVASHETTPSQTQPTMPTKIVPARVNKEILIRGRGMPVDLAKRTPQEVIQAINQVSMKKGAVAARRLPSGDAIVTFQSAADRDWHSTNVNWIKEAFGQQAEESKRTFAVLLKGVWKKDLHGVTEEEFGKETGLRTVDKVKFRVPKHREATRATVLVALTSQEEARKACNEGVIWRAQLLDCEPYWAPLSPTQCYKCWKWGHTQHYCKATPLCPRCGTKAHGEGGSDGEAQCPTRSGGIPLRCPVCEGRHPAWSGECPEKSKALTRAREAYRFRPRTYEAAASTPHNTDTIAARTPYSFANGCEHDDDYEVVNRKRMRGRPTIAAAAQHQALRDPQQTRISFGPTGARFGDPAAIGAGITASPPQPAGPAAMPAPATGAASTAAAATGEEGEDVVMETITVADDES